VFQVADKEIAETLIWRLWQEYLPAMRPLKLCDGRTVRIFRPGRLNSDGGPDFLDAALSFGPGPPLSGDVEIHVRPADWTRHGHNRDARYNGVLLHVVMWDDAESHPVLKQNGQHVPKLALSSHLRFSLETLHRRKKRIRPSPYPCQQHRWEAETFKTALLHAARIRLSEKIATLEKRLLRVSPEQTLYEHLMRAAGYAKNAEPFAKLARLLPIATLREVLADVHTQRRTTYLQAALFGAAGWLETGATCTRDAFYDTLGGLWGDMCVHLGLRPMRAEEWQFFRLRPFNFPTVRLSGMVSLVRKGLEKGLDARFGEICAKDTEPGRLLRLLRETLDHLFLSESSDGALSDFLLGGTQKNRHALIGTDRKSDMTINAVLPFLLAVARRADNERLEKRLYEVFELYPKLPENAALRTMQTLVLG